MKLGFRIDASFLNNSQFENEIPVLRQATVEFFFFTYAYADNDFAPSSTPISNGDSSMVYGAQRSEIPIITKSVRRNPVPMRETTSFRNSRRGHQKTSSPSSCFELDQINSQVSPRSLKFVKNVHGKPEVDWQYCENWCPQPLHFNISHTSSLIACGVTVDSPIGVDVEEKHRRLKHNLLSFAQRYFSKHEVQMLSAISDPQLQQQEFIKLWTLKEAYVKALGRGFSGAPFKTFTIQIRTATKGSDTENSISEASEIVVDSSDDAMDLTNNWKFVLLDLAGSHYASICTKKDCAIEGKQSTPKELTVWKTIPFVQDECVSGTEAVVIISDLS